MSKLVKTINGLEIAEEKCRLIDGKYYLIGNPFVYKSGDVYEINNRFIREESGRIIFNHTKSQYELKSQTKAVEGYVFYDFNNNEFIKGYFEYNELYDNIIQDENNINYIVHRNCNIPLSYRYDILKGKYLHISLQPAFKFYSKFKIKRDFKESFPYSITSQEISNKKQTFEHYYNPIFNKNVKNISNIIKNLSFGVEFETIEGIISKNILKYLPLVPLRDGSISGLEYVTIPLQGEIGVQALIDSCVELEKSTSADSSCSLHIHIGNIPRTKEFILAFFKLYNLFSFEFYNLFPFYKERNCNIKRKNYSAPYEYALLSSLDKMITPENIDKNFSYLFNYLAESDKNGYTFDKYQYNLNNVISHPQDPSGNSKWNIHNRYHVVNFIPLIFGNKQTIEFRIHTPTTNSNKIIYFLILISSFINYTIENETLILTNYDHLVKKFSRDYKSNLMNFLFNYLDSIKITNRNSLYDDISNYFSNRNYETQRQLSNGILNYDESIINSNFNLDLVSKPNIINFKYFLKNKISDFEVSKNDNLIEKYHSWYDANFIRDNNLTSLEQLRINSDLVNELFISNSNDNLITLNEEQNHSL